MKKSKRVKKSNTWKIKQHRDLYFKKSKTLGFRSRASFKLLELNKKFKFINRNTKLLDLGSFPGGWSQVASKIIITGKILSIDIKPMKPISNVKFMNCNIFEKNTKEKINSFFKDKIDVIISDSNAATLSNSAPYITFESHNILSNERVIRASDFLSITTNSPGFIDNFSLSKLLCC